MVVKLSENCYTQSHICLIICHNTIDLFGLGCQEITYQDFIISGSFINFHVFFTIKRGIMSNKRGNMSYDPIRAFIDEMAWILDVQAVRNMGMTTSELARRAYTTQETVSRFRSNIHAMQGGVLLPLPVWSSVFVLAWAARPVATSSAYQPYLQRLERLEGLYYDALQAQPRERGTTASMRAIKPK
jgi:hypothetical protein